MIDCAAVRADFPLLGSTVNGRPLVYLDNAATTQKPRAVLGALQDFYSRSNSNVHRGAHYLADQANQAYEGARHAVARFINSPHEQQVILTHGTTDAINMVARSFADHGLETGDNIVITEMEHHSNLLPWRHVCEMRGAELRVVPFADDGGLRLDLMQEMIGPRTRLVAVCHVSNVLGSVNPIRPIADLAHAEGVPILVDAAQSTPHLPIDVQHLDCDFLAFSGHKVYADTGIGVLYGKDDSLARLQPSQFGGGMVDSVGDFEVTLAQPPFRFEAGTPHVAGAVSLHAAIDYIHSRDFTAIQQHERELTEYAMQRLNELPDIRLYGTTGDRCGVISFNLGDCSAYDTAMILDKLGVAVRSGTHCAQPVMKHFGISGAVRASLAMYNTRNDIDGLVRGLEQAADLLL